MLKIGSFDILYTYSKRFAIIHARLLQANHLNQMSSPHDIFTSNHSNQMPNLAFSN